ncbi:NAD(P) transhydrogenase subunit alpha [Roseivirga sp. BDSF3-8]|uniref:NAD(P) transhydrogenase subunit alpha n=1 Tax=Roseivirga sp. BDSF3-8 TaxID=3241598 RepID=UPI003531C4FF
MQIGILKEPEHDPRVCMVPDTVHTLIEDGHTVLVEKGAGLQAFFDDQQYADTGASLADRQEILKASLVACSITPLKDDEYSRVNKDAVFISQFEPFARPDIPDLLASINLSAFSLDMIPRITLAQSMDVLSSMASIAGYKAVLLAAGHLPRYFPMLTTAAGSIPPAKALILGAGVAGLQAIATARRLGAVVEAFDTRSVVKEEVESLGGKFVMVEGARDEKGAGGYAVEQSDEYKKKQQELIKDRIAKSDVVITTAQLRGRPAPTLIPESTVKLMRPGSVIIDLASSTGGNCELSKDRETVKHYGVTIVGDSNLSALAPVHASMLYSKNLFNYLKVFIAEDKSFSFDPENPVAGPSCLVYQGKRYYQHPT